MPRNLPKATIEPVKVTAPINTPKNISVKWGHIYNANNRSYLTAASSNYNSQVLYEDEIFGFSYQNGVNVLSAKSFA